MSVKPTVLFVHGLWHTPNHFKPVRNVFEKAGYETCCPQQPSVGNLPPTSLMEDAQCITDALARLVEAESKDVVIVAHSYGGMVTNQGTKAHFAKAARTQEGKLGGVVRIIFMTAFFVDVGSSLATALGGTLPPFLPVDEQEMCTMLEPERRFFSDLPKEDQDYWVKEMRKSPIANLVTPLTHSVYDSYPVSYLYATVDEAIPLAVQESMVDGISQQYKLTVPTETLAASHSPYLSMPEQVLIAVEKQLNMTK